MSHIVPPLTLINSDRDAVDAIGYQWHHVLKKGEIRSEVIHPMRLYAGNIYTIDFTSMFPEIMPKKWCVGLQLIQAVIGENEVENPTLHMNIEGDNIEWKHKTSVVGPGPVFHNDVFAPGVAIDWQLEIYCWRNKNRGYIILRKNGVEVFRMDGQTFVDVNEPCIFKFGLYAKEWDDINTRQHVVTNAEITKLPSPPA